MSGRTGWVARYTLRLGLLLGGMAVVWGAHEVASGSAAHAADRPSGPLTATVGVLTHTLGTALGLPMSGTDDGGAPPSGSGGATAGPTAPAAPVPDSGAPSPTPGVSAPAPGPVQPAAPGKAEPTAPGKAGPSAPGAVPAAPAEPAPGRPGGAAPVTGRVVEAVVTPVRDHMLAPVADGLRPVTGPVTVGVLDPVADLLSPVVEPLRPILGPVWRGLEPVLDPLDPVLDPLSPVTDLLDPPEPGPPAAPDEPVPGPADPGTPVVPADPAATPAPAPAPGRAHDTPPRGPVLAASAARTPTVVGARWVDSVRSRAPATVGPAAHVTTAPALPLPLDGVTHGGGAVHSEPADAHANRWRLPALTHRYARPAAEPLPPSRTSRPGTRPA
ncbi:hypothetical protein [Micromonospora sp. WMMA1947]|uniref:hypothetical protein n=1 Tax=Micromonospora sp. WMMA1947 TaxID=3015163 RepID=UPI00248C681F|nr:hypothetical protein [Micromonospora sp. WMMA1947]WBC08079.1 hypothetical protein O7604_22995 [Micromonospora sp. WMMA1947]